MAIEFLAAGVLWIALTDALVYLAVPDPELRIRLQTLKGWLFVAVAAAFVYATIHRHMSRIQRSEATVRAILNSIGDGLLILGKDGRIAEANPAALDLLGVDDKSSLLGMDAEEFSRRFHWSYPDGTLVPPGTYVSQRALKGETVSPYKAILYPEKGPPRTISSNAAPVRINGDPEVALSVSVLRDITQMEALDRLRDDFFAAAAHSLKTPVTVIRSHAQLLSRTASERERPSVLAIDRQARQIDRLVQNLLVLSRLKSGTMKLHQRQVPLQTIAESVSKEMRSASQHHVVREEWQAHPTVYADPERTALALKNLLDWAFTTSQPNTEVTMVLGERGDRARVGVRYRPWPAGEPRPSPPQQAVEGVRQYAGLDVGRHVSAELLAAQGGGMEVESSPEETTAWLVLPSVERSGVPHAG